MNLHQFKRTKHMIDLDLLPAVSSKDVIRVVDAGASYGEFMTELVSVCSPFKIMLLCLEPSRRAIEKLKEEQKKIDFYDIAIMPLALSHKGGERVKFTEFVGVNGKYHQWGNITGSYERQARNRKDFIKFNRYEVKTTSLDDIAVAPIDYLKMDIEGAEYDILKHATPEIMSNIRQLSMEYHDPESYKWCEKKLTDLGFKTVIRKKEEIYAARI